VGSPCSLGIHESQSRFVENIVGRSLEFWSYFLPKLKELTGATFQDLDVKGFTRLVNIVRPSKIRIEADEVTYSLHVIIRFELEKEIVAGNISTSELPEVWNQKYKDYLDVTIEHDSEGVMQDTHWASGLIGYFPTYALGNIYSGQILAEMEKSLPEWRTQVSQGDFSHVKRWMTENVYRYGNLYDPVELVRKITEQDVTVKPFIDYLKRKYREIYP
ncbi:MAG: carboxypeptidase M32, partial [Nitrososphaerota archaeon]